MKYVRVHLKAKNKTKSILIFLIILAIFLSSSFYLLNKINSNAIIEKATEEKEFKVKQDSNGLNGNPIQNKKSYEYKYFIVQLGFFKVEQNANIFSKKLIDKGISNTIVNKDGYIVVHAIENNKIYVTNIEKHLLNSKVSYIIKSVEFSTNNETLIRLNQILSIQIEILNNQSKLEQLSIENEMLKFDNKNKNQNIDRIISEFEKNVEEFRDNYSSNKFDRCLMNLANEIYILKELNGFISHL